MNPGETEDLARPPVRDHARARGNIGILLIDHDLRFVNRLSSEWILVLNHGDQKIAQGTPDQRCVSNPGRDRSLYRAWPDGHAPRLTPHGYMKTVQTNMGKTSHED